MNDESFGIDFVNCLQDGLFIDGCSTPCLRNRARLKIFHSGEIDQDMTVLTSSTSTEW